MQPIPEASPRRSRSRVLRRGWLALVVWLNACFNWRPVDLTPTRVFRPTEEVRVHHADERITQLVGVRFVADTLVGYTTRPSSRVASPLSDIRQVETLRLNKTRTAVGFFVVVGTLAAILASAMSDMDLGLGSAPIF